MVIASMLTGRKVAPIASLRVRARCLVSSDELVEPMSAGEEET